MLQLHYRHTLYILLPYDLILLLVSPQHSIYRHLYMLYSCLRYVKFSVHLHRTPSIYPYRYNQNKGSLPLFNGLYLQLKQDFFFHMLNILICKFFPFVYKLTLHFIDHLSLISVMSFITTSTLGCSE